MKLTAYQPQTAPISLRLFFGLLLLLPLMAVVMWTILTLPRHQEIKLAPGTEDLVKQTAIHLSKLSGGVNVGGFPGFEPPEDDKKYQEKIKNQQFLADEINGWVREINNFLQQIVDKNPNLTLAEILKQLGKSTTEIEDFMDRLRAIQMWAESYRNFGINSETLDNLQHLMQILGVESWL